jgi:hypothetical protein
MQAAGDMLRDMGHEIAAPRRTDDPDTPSEAVGSWPTVDLAGLGLPPLGWMFVAAALFVAVAHLRSIGQVPLDVVPDVLLSTIAAVVAVLLPAAVLWRAHDAVRTHPLLLTGLALAAAAQLILGAYRLWPITVNEAGTRTAFDAAWPLLTPLGGVLIGLGLLRLRAWPTRLPVLAATVGIYVGLSVASYFVGAGTGTLGAYDAALLVIFPAAAAVAVWVPVSAWLDTDAPPAFWTLLAIALPIGLVSRVLLLVGTAFATSMRSNDLFLPTMTVNAFLDGVVALLALVAFARLTPTEGLADRADREPGRP